MRKSLLLISALACALCASATTTTVAPGERALNTAVAAAQAGDTLLLSEGIYTEWNATTIAVPLTLMPAGEGKPELRLNKIIITAAEGISVIGMDVTNLGTDYVFRTGGNVTGTISFRDCTFHDSSTPYFYGSSNAIGTIVIDNCTFDTNSRNEGGTIYCSGVVDSFTMTRSTVTNHSGTFAVRLSKAAAALVDHCTFYNNGQRVILIGETTASDNVTVSNCIVSNPAQVDGYAIATYGGAVTNCLYYNTASAPRSSSATVTGTINADPLFVDAENGDLTLGEGSPALNAATDGTHLGDPRWYPAVAPVDPTALETISREHARKQIIDGRVVIVRGDKIFDLLGREMK